MTLLCFLRSLLKYDFNSPILICTDGLSCWCLRFHYTKETPCSLRQSLQNFTVAPCQGRSIALFQALMSQRTDTDFNLKAAERSFKWPLLFVKPTPWELLGAAAIFFCLDAKESMSGQRPIGFFAFLNRRGTAAEWNGPVCCLSGT